MTARNAADDEHIATMNSLLRGELAAVDTYDHAIEEMGNGMRTAELMEIQLEHVAAAEALRDVVLQLGGEPETSAGAWGTLARAVEGAAAMLGNKTTLRALRAGEESGLASYEDALETNLPASCTTLISGRLLPQTRDHLAILDDRLLQDE